MQRFENQVAIVTGGGRGIGAARKGTPGGGRRGPRRLHLGDGEQRPLLTGRAVIPPSGFEKHR